MVAAKAILRASWRVLPVTLEHAAAGPERAEEPAVVEPAAAEPESAVIEAPEPESAVARYARERIDAWIRSASSPIRPPPVCSVVSRSSRGRIGRRRRTARRERAFIGPVTPNGVLSGKRRRGRRWGSRAEPFRNERSRRMRGADVARVAGSPPAAAIGRAFVRAICAAAGSCAGTPSTMIAAGKLIEHEAGPEPGDSMDSRHSTTSGPARWRGAMFERADALLHEAIDSPNPSRPDRETETLGDLG